MTKSGRVSKKYKIEECGDMEVSIASCDCGANWECVDFLIDENGYFLDYKYVEEDNDQRRSNQNP